MNALNDWVQRLLEEIGDLSPLTQLWLGFLLLVFMIGAITAIVVLH